MPALKSSEIFGAKTRDPLTDPFEGFFLGQFLFSFRKEEVGVGNDGLFPCLGNHITNRQGEVLRPNGCSAEADTDMPLTDQGVAGPAFGFEEFAAFVTVRQVREIAMTTDGRSMDKSDANVVEKGRFFNKGEIDAFAGGKTTGHRQGLDCDRLAVGKKNLPSRITKGIILFQE